MFYAYVALLSVNAIIFIVMITLLFRQRRVSKNLSRIGEKASEGNLHYVINQSYNHIEQLTADVEKLSKQKEGLASNEKV